MTKLLHGNPTLFVDQYGYKYTAKTLADLHKQVGKGRVERMFLDQNGKTYHIGYIVGKLWLRAYLPYAQAVQ